MEQARAPAAIALTSKAPVSRASGPQRLKGWFPQGPRKLARFNRTQLATERCAGSPVRGSRTRNTYACLRVTRVRAMHLKSEKSMLTMHMQALCFTQSIHTDHAKVPFGLLSIIASGGICEYKFPCPLFLLVS